MFRLQQLCRTSHICRKTQTHVVFVSEGANNCLVSSLGGVTPLDQHNPMTVMIMIKMPCWTKTDQALNIPTFSDFCETPVSLRNKPRSFYLTKSLTKIKLQMAFVLSFFNLIVFFFLTVMVVVPCHYKPSTFPIICLNLAKITKSLHGG